MSKEEFLAHSFFERSRFPTEQHTRYQGYNSAVGISIPGTFARFLAISESTLDDGRFNRFTFDLLHT